MRGDIRRDIRALNRLSDRDGSSIDEVERTLVGGLLRAGPGRRSAPEGRRAFAARVAGRTQAAQRIKVLDFQGVFVSGRRALAQVVYRLSTRAPSGRFVARPPAIWTVTLSREDGRWRFVRGHREQLERDRRATPATTSTAPAIRRAGTFSRPAIAAPAAAITTLVSRSAATGAASARSSAASTSR